jgi:hypothetical protein
MFARGSQPDITDKGGRGLKQPLTDIASANLAEFFAGALPIFDIARQYADTFQTATEHQDRR